MEGLIKGTLEDKAPQWLKEEAAFLAEHGNAEIGRILVEHLFKGMRGLPSRISRTSRVLPTGLNYLDFTMNDLVEQFPAEYLAERVLLMFLFGEMPNGEQIKALSVRLRDPANQRIPPVVRKYIEMTRELPPMDVLCGALQTLNFESACQQAKEKIKKPSDRWPYAVDDFVALVAKLPRIIGAIHQMRTKGSLRSIRNHYWEDGDLGSAYARYLNLKGPEADQFMSLFLALHACHETGPASTNAAMVAGNAWATLYQSLVSGINALAGDRHAGANHKALQQLQVVLGLCGFDRDKIEAYYQRVFDRDQVAWALGHPVYTVTDPRYSILKAIALEHFGDESLVRLACLVEEIVPPLMKLSSGELNPKRFPNIDLMSGPILYAYGLEQHAMYPVLFAASRAIGISANIILALLFEDKLDRPSARYYNRETGRLEY